MKRFLKIFIIIILILIIIFFINFIRNYIIFNNLSKLGNSTLNSNDNYHIVESVVFSTDYLQKDEYWRKENKYFQEHYYYNDLENQSNNEFVCPYVLIDELTPKPELFTIIRKVDDDYIIHTSRRTFKYDKNTGLLKNVISNLNDTIITVTSYTYEFNTVTDADVDKQITVTYENSSLENTK